MTLFQEMAVELRKLPEFAADDCGTLDNWTPDDLQELRRFLYRIGEDALTAFYSFGGFSIRSEESGTPAARYLERYWIIRHAWALAGAVLDSLVPVEA